MQLFDGNDGESHFSSLESGYDETWITLIAENLLSLSLRRVMPPATPIFRADWAKTETPASRLSVAMEAVTDQGHSGLQLLKDDTTVEWITEGGVYPVIKTIIAR